MNIRAHGFWVVGLLLCWALAEASEPVAGAVDSRSVHETAEEESAEREHEPHHGGYFGDADDIFHYELVLEESGRLIFYVNDESNHPLNVRTLTGRWILDPDAASPATGMFAPAEDGAYFLALLPLERWLQAEAIPVEVAVMKDGEWIGMEFHLPLPPPVVDSAGAQRIGTTALLARRGRSQ
jgi:hypothetical protein